MNNGDIESVRSIFSRHPNGRFLSAPGTLSWQRPALWKGNQQLLKVSIDNQTIDYVTLSNKPGGGIIAPPVSIPKYNICIAWDSLNGGLYAVNQENLNIEWTINIRPTMQPVVFLDSGELVINSYENNSDHIVVIDLESGESIKIGTFLTLLAAISSLMTYKTSWVRPTEKAGTMTFPPRSTVSLIVFAT